MIKKKSFKKVKKTKSSIEKKSVKRLPKPSHKTSNLISGMFYVLLNAMLALSIVGVVDLFDSPWLGLIIVAISKWRIFSVKIRFWWANLASNFTDLLVGVSYVFLISFIGYDQLYYQLGLAGLYLIWLLFIKPGTTSAKIMTQGLVAVFVANLVLSLFGHGWNIVFFLLAELFIAYNIMGHYLKNSDFELKYARLMSGVWAVIMAELAWIYWHWMVGYVLLAGIKISQFAIVSTVLTFLAYKTLYYMNQEPGFNRRNLLIDLVASIVFVVVLIIIMVLFFSKPVINL